jgi:hypothetical protein
MAKKRKIREEKSRASDAGVGQTFRYMGFVQDELAAESAALLALVTRERPG